MKSHISSMSDILKHLLIFDFWSYLCCRALCRIKLLPVTHVLVDTWMLTVKLIYKLSNVPDELKWATNTHVTPFTLTFKAELTISMVFLFCFIFLPVHPYFYPSIFVFTRPTSK